MIECDSVSPLYCGLTRQQKLNNAEGLRNVHKKLRLATMYSNIHISLNYVITFIVGSNISMITCKASFIRL